MWYKNKVTNEFAKLIGLIDEKTVLVVIHDYSKEMSKEQFLKEYEKL